ncbi:MAG: tyrosine-type recombinase/integrase [Prevotella sp.]|nr:tyrosine-type recombinase/integrase [Prevotella sp.]
MGLPFHQSRHTFSVLALNNGVSLEALSKMLGHISIRTTQVYAHITDRKISREMKMMKNGLENTDENV